MQANEAGFFRTILFFPSAQPCDGEGCNGTRLAV